MLILLTGFQPFGGADTNASWDAVSSLADPPGVHTVRHRLPVSYERAADDLYRLLDRLRPDALVLTGLDAGAQGLRVESTAHAGTATAPDEDGEQPAPLTPGTTGDLSTTLDVERLAARSRGADVDARPSSDAGRFVCNWTYHAGLEWTAQRRLEGLWSPPTVFVHVPPASVVPTTSVANALSRLLEDVVRQVRAASPTPATVSVGGCRALLLWRPRHPVGRALRIGVSGGIGTGKSSVTEVLRARGAVVADADRIAREVVEPGTPGLEEVVDAFGPRVLASSGVLDRRRLAEVVFADPGARDRLEAITLPRIAGRARQVMDAAPVDGVAVYDMPLLVEVGAGEEFDAVVMVDATASSRLERLAVRGIDEGDARARMATQADAARRREVTTVWIDNEGTRAELEEVVGAVATRWLGIDGAPGGSDPVGH